MTQNEQIQAFSDDLHKLVLRYVQEFQLTTAGAVGVLEIMKYELIKVAQESEDD